MQDRTVCAVVTGDEDCLLKEETLWEVEKVDKVETATIDVVPSTIALYILQSTTVPC